METNQASTAKASKDVAAAVKEVPATKTINRVKVKVKRTKDSFRPGAQNNMQVRKALHIYLPTNGGSAVDEETVEVKALAKQLAEAGGLPVNAVVIRANTFEIELGLPNVKDQDDNEMLSDTFRLLNDVITESDLLKNGLAQSDRPSWCFKIDDFVADKGGL